jgi:hypothetical protein
MKGTALRCAATLIVGLSAGCGVQPTGVVDAGEPAKGIVPGTTVYFVFRGQLAPVRRPELRPDNPKATLQSLFDGPTAEEESKGAATELPRDFQIDRVDGSDGASIVVQVPSRRLLAGLSDVGYKQISCTASGLFETRDEPRRRTVLLGDGTTAVARLPACPV